MHKNTLNAAVKRYSSEAMKPESELKELLAKDDKQFSGEEIDEIYKALKGEKPAKTEPEKPKEKHLNDGLGLEDINYDNLLPNITCDEDDEQIIKATDDFQKYREVEKNLVWNKQYVFDCIRARGQFRKKADGNQVLVGLKIISATPKFTTTIEARHIIGLYKDHTGLNAQIHNPDNLETNSIFYLLRKP